MSAANVMRGEAPLKIGGHELVIAIEMGALAKYSAATGIDDFAALTASFIGFSPRCAPAALECFTVSGDWKAALAELSMADWGAWRDGFSLALAGHLEKGRAKRAEPDPQ